MDIQSVSYQAPTPVMPDNAALGAARSAAVARSAATTLETAKAVRKSAEAPSSAQVNQAVDQINASMQSQPQSQNLVFSVDSSSHQTVVKVVDQLTMEVIRQMPTKEALDIARTLSKLAGKLIKQKA